MVTYTTEALVKKRAKKISADLLTADIEENINQAESMIDIVMRQTGRGASPDFTFDADKHGIIRNAATCLAASLCLTYDTSGFTTTADANFALDLLWNEANRCLALLFDEKGKAYTLNS